MSGEIPGDVGRVAVIMVDLQNDFCRPEGFFAQRLGFEPTAPTDVLITNANRIASKAREVGAPIIWTRNIWRDAADVGVLADRRPILQQEGLRSGTWGAELVDELDVASGDTVLDKRRFSAFYETDLETLLRDSKITSLIFCGIRTDYCVESTVRDAFFRDFRVFVVEDATASYEEDLHETTLRQVREIFGWVVSAEEAIELLGGHGTASSAVKDGERSTVATS